VNYFYKTAYTALEYEEVKSETLDVKTGVRKQAVGEKLLKYCIENDLTPLGLTGGQSGLTCDLLCGTLLQNKDVIIFKDIKQFYDEVYDNLSTDYLRENSLGSYNNTKKLKREQLTLAIKEDKKASPEEWRIKRNEILLKEVEGFISSYGISYTSPILFLTEEEFDKKFKIVTIEDKKYICRKSKEWIWFTRISKTEDFFLYRLDDMFMSSDTHRLLSKEEIINRYMSGEPKQIQEDCRRPLYQIDTKKLELVINPGFAGKEKYLTSLTMTAMYLKELAEKYNLKSTDKRKDQILEEYVEKLNSKSSNNKDKELSFVIRVNKNSIVQNHSIEEGTSEDYLKMMLRTVFCNEDTKGIDSSELPYIAEKVSLDGQYTTKYLSQTIPDWEDPVDSITAYTVIH
jgi:hypothetical protein